MPKLPFPSLCWMVYLFAIRLLRSEDVCVEAGWQCVCPGRSRNLGIFQSWIQCSQTAKRWRSRKCQQMLSWRYFFFFFYLFSVFLFDVPEFKNEYEQHKQHPSHKNDLKQQSIISFTYFFLVNMRSKNKNTAQMQFSFSLYSHT